MQYDDIQNELSQNFIEYAAAVNTDRAIPDATSGLKPVTKRILWSAYESGYLSSKPHVKCAKIVGTVMGSYHPHGDSSIYGALTRLSQNWIMRYPLIDWHGNNGNIAGDNAAHMRYTEAKLSAIAEDGLLSGIKKKNVDFISNYDETCEEPITLPSIFPNLLCNPNTGIGIAMSCNWLPHNLVEVSTAIFDYLDGKEPTIPGPDFPTGGVIINKNDLPDIIKKGRGSVKIRGQYKIEKQTIIFYEIPYGTTIERLLDNINEVCDKKDIEGITEIRDESNKKGLRLIIECEKNIKPEDVVKKLFIKTDLQISISYNQVGLVNKTPTELSLKDCIEIYVKHNIQCIIKEAQFDLKKAKARQHIVEGLLKALEDIDNIIALIRESENVTIAQKNLTTKYNFTELQTKAIIDMKLGKLASLEKIELQNENNKLLCLIKELNILINNSDIQIKELKNRLSALVKKYGDSRKTEIIQLDISKDNEENTEVLPENVIVTITQSGNIKRTPTQSFKKQNRGGKGIKNGNIIIDAISTNTIDDLMLFTSKGKVFKLAVNSIPTEEININSLISLDLDENIITLTSLQYKNNIQYVTFITRQGFLKKTNMQEYCNFKRSNGIIAIKLHKDDILTNVIPMNDENMVIITKHGKIIYFQTSSILSTGRATMGSRVIKLKEDDEVISGFPIYKETDDIAIITQKGYGKRCHLTDFPMQLKGSQGISCYKISNMTGDIVGSNTISNNDTLLLFGEPNSICISATDLPLLNRTGVGNLLIHNSKITSIVRLK